MQDPRITPPEGATVAKQGKKKSLNQMATSVRINGEIKGGNDTPQSGKKQKGSKRRLKNEVSQPSLPIQQTDRSTPDSLADASGSTDEYRALRRKYLLLEEENFSLEKELGEVDTEIKTLEDEKFALLDQLVVLEGLVDPSEIQREGRL